MAESDVGIGIIIIGIFLAVSIGIFPKVYGVEREVNPQEDVAVVRCTRCKKIVGFIVQDIILDAELSNGNNCPQCGCLLKR